MKLRLTDLFLQELRFRRLTFLVAVAASGLVAATIVGTSHSVSDHDRETEQLLEAMRTRSADRMAALRDDARVFSKSLGFNVLLLPGGQDASAFYSENRSTAYFDEAGVDALGKQNLNFLNHLLPLLRHRVHWDAFGGDVVLVGIQGQIFIKEPGFQTPIQDEIASGTAHVGVAVQRKLGIQKGQQISLLGQELTVTRILPEKGNIDDFSLLMNLGDLQRLAGLEGRIGGILALSCNCAPGETDILAEEVHRSLPGAQVIEFSVIASAREAARRAVGSRTREQMEDLKSSRELLRAERVSFSRLLVLSSGTVGLLLLASLGFLNARERRTEIAMLRALGLRRSAILGLFLAKAAVAGVGGGILGAFVMLAIQALDGESATVSPGLLTAAIGSTLAVGLLAAVFPAIRAAATDPATILNQE